MDIEDIAEQHSIKDLGEANSAYECGFTQGVNYQRKRDLKKAYEWLEANAKFKQIDGQWKFNIDEFQQAMAE